MRLRKKYDFREVEGGPSPPAPYVDEHDGRIFLLFKQLCGRKNWKVNTAATKSKIKFMHMHIFFDVYQILKVRTNNNKKSLDWKHEKVITEKRLWKSHYFLLLNYLAKTLKRKEVNN